MSNVELSQQVANTGQSWARPPVTEALIGVSFIPKPPFTLAQIGQFWGRFKNDYPITNSAAPVPVSTLKFPSMGILEEIGVYEITGGAHARMQFMDPSGSNMIQVQNGWVLMNWILRPGRPYIGFDSLFQRFKSVWGEFTDFYASMDIGTPELLLAEVTYVNTLVPGALFTDISDLHRALPGLLPAYGDSLRTTTIASHLFFEYRPHPVELHVSIETQKMQKADMSEPPVAGAKVQLQSRAALETTGTWADIETALRLSHQVANESLRQWSSKEALKAWEGKE